MKVLFVDHACHQLTKSSDFFRDLVASAHETDTFYYEQHYHCNLPRAKVDWADIIVFWEFIPFRFACGVPGKRCVFLPMYDNEWGSKGLWQRLALLGMNVVSFCRAVGDHARRCGVGNVLDVRFAFDPAKFRGMSGDPRKVLLWERGDVSFSAVKAMFRPEDVDKVVIIRRDEEGVEYEPISDEDQAVYHVEIKGGCFLPKDEYIAMLSEPGVYIASRRSEGIGMAFLEQMVMGKCVIAHNAPTMSEYIESGKNGILVDMRHPRRIGAEEVAAAREGVAASAVQLFCVWQQDEKRILAFFDEVLRRPPLQSPWSVQSILWYAFYWLEGFVTKLKHF